MRKRFLHQLSDYTIFVFPLLFCIIVIELIPFINGIRYSFTDWNGISLSYQFVGLDNFINSLKASSEMWPFLWLTVKFVLVLVPISNILAILFAALLNNATLKSRGIARVVLFMPSVISAAVISFLWRYLYSTCFDFLGDALGIELLHASWLGDPTMAFWSIAITSLWSSMGFYMLIYIAGFQSIDENVLEASVIDGVSPWQQLIHIKLPMIISSVTVCIFLALSGTFKMFDLPYLMTGGGPAEATTTLSINIFIEAFMRHSYGMATARSLILFAFVLVVTLIQVNVSKKREIRI